MEKKYGQGKLLLWFTVMAALLLLLCSKSSPIFPLNDWMDANAFFTLGKAMMNGLVPYRDAFDHKGPLLHFVYGIAWLLDHNGFFGVFLIEILCFTFFLYYSYKTVCMFTDKVSPLLMLLPGAAVVSAKAFVQGGSAEELCLPLFAMALCSLLRFASQLPEQRTPLSLREVFVQGCLAGCVLWTKFTLLGLFLGWVLWFAAVYLRRGWYKPLVCSCAVYLGGGMGLTTLPWLLYFGVHKALGDLFYDYFGVNLFFYSGITSSPLSWKEKMLLPFMFIRKLWWAFRDSPFAAALVIVGLAFLAAKAVCSRQFSVLTAILCTGTVFSWGILEFGEYLTYYPLPLLVYLPLVLVPITALLTYRKAACLALPLAFALCLWVSPNRRFRFQPREGLPQWQFADMIHETGAQTKLLNYGTLDGGFYTTTKLLPPCRFSCVIHVCANEALEQQNDLLRHGEMDYVVALKPDLDQQFPAYELSASSTYDSGEGMRTWYLYRKKEA